ncbi:MAG: hypothetical protein WBF49_08900, partial [Methyloceanibacter sp.]
SDDGDTTGHDFTPLACSTYSPQQYIIVNNGWTGWVHRTANYSHSSPIYDQFVKTKADWSCPTIGNESKLSQQLPSRRREILFPGQGA